MRGKIDTINIEINGIDSSLSHELIDDLKNSLQSELFSLFENQNYKSFRVPDLQPIIINSHFPKSIPKKITKEVSALIKQQLKLDGGPT